jgi:hypothetical protein
VTTCLQNSGDWFDSNTRLHFMAVWTKGKLVEPLVLETNVLESSNLSAATKLKCKGR